MSIFEITIITILVGLLFFLLNDSKEKFNQDKFKTVKQCDYNDKDLTSKCKEVINGCVRVKKDTSNMIRNLKSSCNSKEGKTVRETISMKRDCVTDVERLIRSNYAQNELCSRVKNMPEEGKDERLQNLNINDFESYEKNNIYSSNLF
jgi:hypothetical protein